MTSDNLRGKWRRQVYPRDVPGLTCAGRLDADSSGLLLWTDDEALAQHVIGPDSPVEKEYIVRISGQANYLPEELERSLKLLQSGLSLDGVALKPADVAWLNESQLRFVLREGRYRQIRRMLMLVGLDVQVPQPCPNPHVAFVRSSLQPVIWMLRAHEVFLMRVSTGQALKRVRIGKLRLAGLPVGHWAPLSPAQASSMFLPSFKTAQAAEASSVRSSQPRKSRSPRS